MTHLYNQECHDMRWWWWDMLMFFCLPHLNYLSTQTKRLMLCHPPLQTQEGRVEQKYTRIEHWTTNINKKGQTKFMFVVVFENISCKCMFFAVWEDMSWVVWCDDQAKTFLCRVVAQSFQCVRFAVGLVARWFLSERKYKCQRKLKETQREWVSACKAAATLQENGTHKKRKYNNKCYTYSYRSILLYFCNV